jgi:succinate-acetate transporter protein
MSYAGILINSFGILDAYAYDPNEFNSIMGFFLLAWFFYAFIMWTCTFKSTWSFFFVIGFICWYLFFLSLGYFLDSMGLKKTAGVLAILSSLSGFYAIFEGIATPENSYVHAPSLLLPGAPRV